MQIAHKKDTITPIEKLNRNENIIIIAAPIIENGSKTSKHKLLYLLITYRGLNKL